MAFHIRPMTAADFPRMVEIMAKQVPDPPTVERLEQEEEMVAKFPDMFVRRIGAFDETGLLMGYGVAVRSLNGKPGHIQVNVRVDKPFRNQGVGSALYAEVDRLAREQRATTMSANARDNEAESVSWAQRRGFVQKQHLFESTLALESFDPSPYDGAIPAAEASGIRFTSFAEFPQDDAGLQRYVDFLWELFADVPGSEGMSQPTLEMLKQQIAVAPETWDPHGMVLAVDGDTWAALAWVAKQPSGSYYHTLTGVKREYRGRGLALAVKLKALEYARSQGAPYVRTNNDSNNQRMLAVNRKMGYQPEPGFFVMERPVEG